LFFFFSAIAISRDSSFKKDQDILVLPLDLLKFDTHKKLTEDVLKHFGKVRLVTLNLQNIKRNVKGELLNMTHARDKEKSESLNGNGTHDLPRSGYAPR